MTEPQVWALIGVFAASMFGVIGLVLRTIRAEITTLRAEMQAGFAAVDRRFEYLERDVSALYRHTFGIDKD